MITLIIYLIGFISSYILLRNIGRRNAELGKKRDDGGRILNYSWTDVFQNLLFSLTSWFVIFVFLTVCVIEKYNEAKPPKFL